MGADCEKYRQYRLGSCSVTYAARDDDRVRYTYAVCDHRLDGEPVQHAIRDHFPTSARRIYTATEIVLTDPVRTSFDYAAFTLDDRGEIDDLIVIEAQAIDTRGGGVGPAWQALEAGEPEQWREYFTRDAAAPGRKDTVAYGVNMANIYKRLGMQVAVKGAYLQRLACSGDTYGRARSSLVCTASALSPESTSFCSGCPQVTGPASCVT